MTHKINTANTAAVAIGTHWLPIDANTTPQGVSMEAQLSGNSGELPAPPKAMQ